MSTVSVVLPTYNRAACIGRAVQSALAQDGCEVEVLVCDDGSTDETRHVIGDIGDDRVRWLPGEPSGGPSRPRNRGIAAARGDWIAFLDSDDVWLPGKLQAQLAAMRSDSTFACSTNGWRDRGRGAALTELLQGHLPRLIELPTLLRANLVITSSMIVNSKVLQRVGGFPDARANAIFEDYALWLRVAHITSISVLERPFICYMDGPTGSYRSRCRRPIMCTWNSLRDYRRWRTETAGSRRCGASEYAAQMSHLASQIALRAI